MLWEQKEPQIQFEKTGNYHTTDNFSYMMAIVSEGSAWMSPKKKDWLALVTELWSTILLTASVMPGPSC